MSRTTISVDEDVKEALAAEKPDGTSWNAFLKDLVERPAADPDELDVIQDGPSTDALREVRERSQRIEEQQDRLPDAVAERTAERVAERVERILAGGAGNSF